jgi:uncharacterized protein
MMVTYLDTSALVKRVNDEPGAELVAQVWDGASRIVSSRVAYAETRAAVAAATRAGRLDAAGLRRAVCQLETLFDDLDLVDTDGEVASIAGGLAERHGLSGADAIHLAAAATIDAPRVVVTTWDRKLAEASEECGMAVLPSLRAAA